MKELPKFLKSYFWDADFKEIDPRENRVYILKRILKEIGERQPVKVLGRDFQVLAGHTPFQVIVGGLLGIGITCLWITLH